MNPDRRYIATALPVLGAGVLGIGFWRMLHGLRNGGFNPHAVHTPHVGRPIPAFTLPGLPDLGGGFSSQELHDQPRPVLVNFFASWCAPCVEEMPGLRAIARDLPLWGIAYKDGPEDASSFVRRDGSPYARVGADRTGRVAIEWGVTGVPESFLVAPKGRILWHSAAGLNPQIVDSDIRPHLSSLR